MPRGPIDRTQLSAVLLSTLLAASIVGAVALAPAVAEHPDDAPDYTGEAFFEISAVSQSDHQPGDQKGSMLYESGGAEAFREQDAEEGVFIDYIIIDSITDGKQWIDYSDCTTDNTAAFGIDRGNNDSGTQNDESLVAHQKQVDYRNDGITIEFYDHSDLGGDPPYMAPEDAIVAQQGEGSPGGPCLQFTDEPGWYRIQGYLNGTVADNGRDSQPSENAKKVEVGVKSTWFYICDCENREEAEQQLGQPPGEGGDGGDESTPSGDESTPSGDESTPTATESGGGGGGAATATESGGGGGGAATATESGGGGGGAATATESGGGGGGAGGAATATEAGNGTGNGAGTGNGTGNGSGADGDNIGDDGGTPTADDGPGFGAVAALIALLGSALLANRRR